MDDDYKPVYYCCCYQNDRKVMAEVMAMPKQK